MAVTLGGIMTALVGFTYNEEGSEHPYRCAAAAPLHLPQGTQQWGAFVALAIR